MKNFAKIHFWYNSIFSEILRVALFLLLTSLVLIGIVYKVYPNLFITVFCLFLIFEVYFSQKINSFIEERYIKIDQIGANEILIPKK